jgi:hypothetical protein
MKLSKLSALLLLVLCVGSLATVARYNTFEYGDGTKYGASAAEDFLYWTFIVDWDADGYFSGENEATRMVGFSSERGRDYYVKPSGRGLEHMRPGRVTAIFDNEDGRYDPFNTSSPLYPYVTPGKFVRIAVLDANTGTNYPVMRGVIEDIQPLSGRKLASITVVDGLQWLMDREVVTQVYPSIYISRDYIPGTDSYSTLSILLDKTDWPHTDFGQSVDEWGTDFGESVEFLDYWWAWQQTALDAIHQLEEAELGVFFVARDGDATFRGRHAFGSSVMTISEDDVLRAIAIPQPWEVVRNVANIYSYPKQLFDVDATLWQLQDVPPIPAGDSVTVYAKFRYNGESVGGGPGTISFNYTVNTASDGTGSDITSQCTHGNTDIGAGVTLTLTNNSSQNGYITLWQAVGDPVYAQSITVLKNEDATSQGKYGPRVLTIDTPWQESTNLAQDYATFMVSFLKDPKYFPIVQVEDRPDIQYGLELYDRVTLDFPTLGVSGDYRVAKVDHQWLNENGRAVRTTIKFEPLMDLSGYWRFTTQLGVSSIFGY